MKINIELKRDIEKLYRAQKAMVKTILSVKTKGRRDYRMPSKWLFSRPHDRHNKSRLWSIITPSLGQNPYPEQPQACSLQTTISLKDYLLKWAIIKSNSKMAQGCSSDRFQWCSTILGSSIFYWVENRHFLAPTTGLFLAIFFGLYFNYNITLEVLYLVRSGFNLVLV